MTPRVFLKRYTDPARGVAARHHRDWLVHLDSGVPIPGAHPGNAHLQILDRVEGIQPGPEDLIDIAAALGQLHGTAHARELQAARLDRPFTTTTGLTIPELPGVPRNWTAAVTWRRRVALVVVLEIVSAAMLVRGFKPT